MNIRLYGTQEEQVANLQGIFGADSPAAAQPLQTLPELFAAIRAAQKVNAEAGTADSKNLPIDFPEPDGDAEVLSETARIEVMHKQIRARILALFENALKALTWQKKPGERPVPRFSATCYQTPDANEVQFNQQDVREALFSAGCILSASDSGSDDSNFREAVSDRHVGLIAILGKIVDIVNRHQNARDVFSNLRMLARNDDESGKYLVDLPWSERSKILNGRLNAVSAADYRARNNYLLSQVTQQILNSVQMPDGKTPKDFTEALKTMFMSAGAGSPAERIGLNALDKAEQFFKLLFAMSKALVSFQHVKYNAAFLDAINTLRAECAGVSTKQEFIQAVDRCTRALEAMQPAAAADRN